LVSVDDVSAKPVSCKVYVIECYVFIVYIYSQIYIYLGPHRRPRIIVTADRREEPNQDIELDA